MGPGIGAAGCQHSGSAGRPHGTFRIAGFQQRFGQPQMKLPAAGFQGQSPPEERRGRRGIVSTAPALEGASLEQQGAGVVALGLAEGCPEKKGEKEGAGRSHSAFQGVSRSRVRSAWAGAQASGARR